MATRAEALITSQNHTLSYVLFGFYILCLIFASIQVLRILYHRYVGTGEGCVCRSSGARAVSISR